MQWVKKYLGSHAKKRLILTHHKNLSLGDYLIDDRITTAVKVTGEPDGAGLVDDVTVTDEPCFTVCVSLDDVLVL